MQLCGNFKATINPVTVLKTYPIPHIEELFTKLTGGVKFMKLDLRDAYQQVELHPDALKYLTINTFRLIPNYVTTFWSLIGTSHIYKGSF